MRNEDGTVSYLLFTSIRVSTNAPETGIDR